MAAITQISRIQHRTGLYRELPTALNEAELGWALDTRQLFIGNGPIHPGNTEIITQNTPASSIFYSYRNPKAYQQLALNGAAIGTNPYVASTGFVETYDTNTGNMIGDTEPTSFNPTIRSYQEKFDEVVSVKDYGAVGDGIADDTGSIIRACKDLYSEEFGAVGNTNDARKRNVALYLPGGVYRIGKSIPAFPGMTLVGDPTKTIIFLDIEISTDEDNEAVLISADSYGQTDGDMGHDVIIDGHSFTPSIKTSGNMRFIGVTFQSNQVFNAPNTGKRQVVRLCRTSSVRFEYCGFQFVENVAYNNDPANSAHPSSLWQPGDSLIDATTAVLFTKHNDQNAIIGTCRFINCSSTGAAHDFNFIDDTNEIVITRHGFNGKLVSVKVGSSATYDYNPSHRHAVSTSGSRNITIEHSAFRNYTAYAIDVYGPAQAVRSFSNLYYGTGKSIRFNSSTLYCSSMMDWFFNSTLATCGSANPRIDNYSNFNTIFNAQDFATISNGIQDLNVCGNILITGSVISNPSAVTNVLLTTVAYPNATISQPNSYKGNSVIVNYAMRIPNSGSPILRTGTIKIIYTESSPGVGGLIQYNDDFVEVGGSGGSGLTLAARFNNSSQHIEIVATYASGTQATLGTPTTKVIVSAVTI